MLEDGACVPSCVSLHLGTELGVCQTRTALDDAVAQLLQAVALNNALGCFVEIMSTQT